MKKILVVYKRSVYQDYLSQREDAGLKKLCQKKSLLIHDIFEAHLEHLHTLDVIKKDLISLGLNFRLENRKKIKIHNEDLIITVGGDGTLLRTAHQVKNIPILGVNSAPSRSVGFLCGATSKNFPKKIREILSGKINQVPLTRLEIKVNRQRLKTLAVNDILYAHSSPAGLSRYLLKIGSKKEEQKSSGIWVATPAGSTAAIRAAGGKALSLTSKEYEFLVREPYVQKNKKFQMIKKILKSKVQFTILNKTKQASLFIDGMQAIFPLHFGDKIIIRTSPFPLYLYL